MAFGDNSEMFTTGNRIYVSNNATNDAYLLDATRANQLIFTAGDSGDDVFVGFDANDTLINYRQLSGDFIGFGDNGTIDIDGTGNGSGDLVNVTGLASKELRYLGSRAGSGAYVYADAATLRQLVVEYGANQVSESKVTNDTFAASDGRHVFLYDTALGLNLGADVISGFGADDLLVTTSLIFNGRSGDPASMLTFGNNGVLDLSGEFANAKGDAGATHGGQIALAGVTGLFLVGTETGVNGVTYFLYGAEPTH